MTQRTTHAKRREAEHARVAQYAEGLLTTVREELQRADTKASIVFASASAVFVTLIATALAGGWSPTHLTGLAALLWWGGAAVACGAGALMGAAVYPRTRGTERSRALVAFYGDIARFADPETLRAALERSAEYEFDQLVDQLIQVSKIVRFKYLLLKMSMWGLLISALICGLTAVL